MGAPCWAVGVVMVVVVVVTGAPCFARGVGSGGHPVAPLVVRRGRDGDIFGVEWHRSSYGRVVVSGVV